MKLSDFHSKTLNDNPSELQLLMDGKPTGEHLLVIGIESRSVARARIDARVAYAGLKEGAEDFDNYEDKEEWTRRAKELIEIRLAMDLIVGWSFEDEFCEEDCYKLLDENDGLALCVIAHATESSNYLKKN
jgi:hypothetical protein